MNIVYLILTFLICYLICSVNFAVIISKVFTKKDIREQGSGNAGMTNMMRSVSVAAGVATLVLDILKGVATMLLCKYVLLPLTGIDPLYIRYLVMYLCATFCLLGHDFPIFFGFKGGKGIASILGIFYIVDWRVSTFCLLVFVIVFVLCRIVSLASVTGVTTAILITFVINYYDAGMYFAVISTLAMILPVAVVDIMHRSNIVKLIKGEEKQLVVKK